MVDRKRIHERYRRELWGDQVVACGKPWRSDSERICKASMAPGLKACLAHADRPSRQDFLATVHSKPASITGLLVNLEVYGELLQELRPIFTSVTPIDFQGSVFFDSQFKDIEFAGGVDFSHCHFRSIAWFEKVIIPGDAYFIYSQFDKDVGFGGRFGGKARFDLSTFSSHVRFGSDLTHGVWFDRAVFESWLALSLRNGDCAIFDGARISRVILQNHEKTDSPSDRDDVDKKPDKKDPAPPLARFNGTTFTGEAEVRSRGNVDVSLDAIVLRNPLSLASWKGEMRLVSLRSVDLEAPLVIGDSVNIGGCRMSHAIGLERLRIVESDPKWHVYRHRQVVADELESVRQVQVDRLSPAPKVVIGEGIPAPKVNPKTVEAIYRQLRAALEASKAYPAAADFYYGEMEMRRLSARRLSTDRLLLALYKLTSGYGVRASRALATYLAVLLLAGAALRYGTALLVADPTQVAASPGLAFTRYWDCVAIAARNSVGFFSGISDGLTAAGTALMFVLRLLGPTMFALAILALRSRVQR
jgi:hypothetical protein